MTQMICMTLQDDVDPIKDVTSCESNNPIDLVDTTASKNHQFESMSPKTMFNYDNIATIIF